VGRGREEKKAEEKKSEKRKTQKKEDQSAQKRRNIEKDCVFSNGLWHRRLAKAAGAEPPD